MGVSARVVLFDCIVVNLPCVVTTVLWTSSRERRLRPLSRTCVLKRLVWVFNLLRHLFVSLMCVSVRPRVCLPLCGHLFRCRGAEAIQTAQCRFGMMYHRFVRAFISLPRCRSHTNGPMSFWHDVPPLRADIYFAAEVQKPYKRPNVVLA